MSSELPIGDALQKVLDMFGVLSIYLWTYYSELVRQGFSEEQAMGFCRIVQMILLQQQRSEE